MHSEHEIKVSKEKEEIARVEKEIEEGPRKLERGICFRHDDGHYVRLFLPDECTSIKGNPTGNEEKSYFECFKPDGGSYSHDFSR